ncbi:21 kDa protein-like [Momordica charantia]|uniref:21 kDa protein-like n=1 Tax=Momordica charantia TaxID=3673 RepID=A0A6J1CXS9_MOMCH|nr:21 kDa protein-like [Momordica charantia]
MASQRPLILSLLFAATLFHLRLVPAAADANATATANATANCTEFIRSSCLITLYPDVCYTSLSRYANAIQQDPASLTRVAITISLANARRMAGYVSNLSHAGDYGADRRAASALHDCFENFDDAVDEIRGSLKQMRQINDVDAPSFRFQMSNVQTWMSAALTDQETCTDGFGDVADGPMKADVCNKAEKVKKHTSNALALVNSFVEKRIP